FPPSELGVKLANEQLKKVMLYSDPEQRELTEAAADYYGVKKSQVIMTNGSDEVLNFAFMAYCDSKTPALFADITYGFYKVFAELNGVKYTEIPLREDFSLSVDDYIGRSGTVFIANPNAPTGKAISLEAIEKLLAADKSRIVVIDEAYVDFGGESAVKLIEKYDNLLMTQTFSKSRSMAGARLGFGIANEKIISDLNTIKYSTNPYNVNRITAAMGVGAIKDKEYFNDNCKKIIKTREWVKDELIKLGFTALDSKTNFLFAKHERVGGEEIYLKLKEKGVLVRHFNKERIKEFNRVTIGSDEQMQTFLSAIKEILEDK
ncbi:MAG: histidinol-phosphate transaminase, partial [Clostridia bacterium]|nr:histidinol-phosphate transaminase [Clostridia bacterium]